MTAVNIISGIILVVASVAIILAVLFSDTHNSGLNSAIGGSSDSFFGGNTREAKINKITSIVVLVFFVVALVVNVLSAYLG